MSTPSRRGTTIVETQMSAAIFTLVVGVILAMLSQASKGTKRANESADALRSVLLASEVIRSELGRMAVADLRYDFVIAQGGREVRLRIPRMGSDMWRVDLEPVTFYLEPIPNAARGFRLVRKDEKGAVPVAGCVLDDMVARLVVGSGTEAKGYLELTLVGLGSESGQFGIPTVQLLPLNEIGAPCRYPARRKA